MKKERQFLQDLYRRRAFKVPFIELFQKHKDLRRELFQQYLSTDTQPDFSLFLNSYYTSKELEKGFKEASEKLPSYESGSVPNNLAAGSVLQTDFEISVKNLEFEFYTLSARKEVSEEFCKHSLEGTQILLELKDVSAHIEDFKKIVLRGKQYNAKEFAENVIKTIIRRRESISIPEVIDVILEEFLKEQENFHIEGEIIFDNEYQFKKRYGISCNEAKANYRELKRYADNYINDYLKNLTNKKQKSPEKKDPRIILNDLKGKDLSKSIGIYEYDSNLKDSNFNGIRINNNIYKVYSPGLCYLFLKPEIKAYNMEAKEDVILDPKPYLTTYIENYKKGEEFFKNKFEFSKDVLFGTNAEKVINDLHYNYYHKPIPEKDLFTGWVFAKNHVPVLITHEILEVFGFYSGVIHKADNYLATYPNVFKDFHNCNIPETLPPQQESRIFEFENNFDDVDVKDVQTHFQTGLVKSKMLSEKELQAFLIAAFQEKTPPVKLFNLKGSPTNNMVMKVFYQYYTDVAGKPYGKQKMYAGLLGNYFQGYKTGTVSSNFSKSAY